MVVPKNSLRNQNCRATKTFQARKRKTYKQRNSQRKEDATFTNYSEVGDDGKVHCPSFTVPLMNFKDQMLSDEEDNNQADEKDGGV